MQWLKKSTVHFCHNFCVFWYSFTDDADAMQPLPYNRFYSTNHHHKYFFVCFRYQAPATGTGTRTVTATTALRSSSAPIALGSWRTPTLFSVLATLFTSSASPAAERVLLNRAMRSVAFKLSILRTF